MRTAGLLVGYRPCFATQPVGFFARPGKQNGVVDMMKWDCGIPGKSKTPWEGGVYRLVLEFSEDYPSRPMVRFLSLPVLVSLHAARNCL
jgi:ubiquitin-protein ligase